MSLRVWLPLNGDLTNNGLSDISVTNNGATVDNAGKIGKCYNFTSTYIEYDNPLPATCTQFSICAWVNLISGYTANYGLHIASFGTSYGRICVSKDGQAVRVLLNDGTTNYAGGSNASASSLTAGVWNHYVVTFDNGIVRIYINGQLDAERTATITYAKLTSAKARTGTYATENSKGYANDVRIYDHALSPKEVKLLSQGLVCHYKLSDIYATDNLIPNGYGQDGATGWINSTNFSTTEIPSGHSEIKASFYGGNATATYVPISQGTTYTLSAYLKAKGSGTSYPSIFPYDADKHIIMAYNCADGFSNSYRTTLAQPLKKGDTIIHATDLSAWTTGDNYYYHVAIFGYKDSQGRVYPDMGYTYDSPVFGTKTDKSHINKTNNTITLNSAFTGEDRPAGTVICQTTEGSTYYYPFGAVTTSSVSDWTLKTAVLNPSTTHRLKYAKYINYMAYSGLYHAGIKLVDNNFSEPYVLDSSGYNNHFKAVGGPTATTDSIRNSCSTYFTNTQYALANKNSNDGFLPTDAITVNLWIKCTTWGNPISCTEGGGWNFENSNGIQFPVYIRGVGYKVANSGVQPSTLLNDWHMLTGVFNGTDVKIYIDTVLKATTTTGSTNGIGYAANRLCVAAEAGGQTPASTYYVGNISDIRIYATALSQEDIQELYNAPVSIANTGTMLTQGEFVEVAT